MTTLAELRKQGKIRGAGLARLDELFRPQAVSGPRYPEPLLETTNA